MEIKEARWRRQCGGCWILCRDLTVGVALGLPKKSLQVLRIVFYLPARELKTSGILRGFWISVVSRSIKIKSVHEK
jgi:hypothetical protein